MRALGHKWLLLALVGAYLLFAAADPVARAAWPGLGTYNVPCPTCFSGSVAASGTASTQLSVTPATNAYSYVTLLACSNSGSAQTVTLQKGQNGATLFATTAAASNVPLVVPFETPLGGDAPTGNGGMPIGTAVWFTAASGVTCNIAGYTGP